MSHKQCTHVRLETGCVLCLRTHAVYIRPDDVPSRPAKGGKAPKDIDLFVKVYKRLRTILATRNIDVWGWVMLDGKCSLPSGTKDFSSIIDYVTTMAKKAERMPS